MRNTTLIVLFLLVISTPFTNLKAQNQINSCNELFTDNGGASANYLNNENTEWLICPDDDNQYLSITFTHVNIEVANNEGVDGTGCYDVLYIYDGTDSSAPLLGSFCGEESGSGKSSFVEGHTLHIGDSFRPKNSDGCIFILFESDQTTTFSGWQADITCCLPSLSNGLTDGIDVPVPENYGNSFDLVIDNSCTRYGNLELFTEFEPSGEACYTKGLTYENQAFYAFTTNSNGGFTEFEIDALDSVGIIEMIVYGPVTLDTLGNYVGGNINDCVTGMDPRSLFFNAGPNQIYILGVATEIAGSTNFNTLPSTVGLNSVLPVEMIHYGINAKDNEVTLSWTTSQEVNNEQFNIFRSIDGIQFEYIGTQKAAVNLKTENNYSFLDFPNFRGTIYYYVQQMDKDGKSRDYPILKATISKPDLEFSSYPNPSNGGNFSITLNQEKLESDARIEIFDGLGERIISRKLGGDFSFEFPNLLPGLYTIKITVGSTVHTNQHMIF